jgi:hypothetical protein
VLSILGLPALAAPLDVRDQNPLLAGFDIPAALPARLPEANAWSFDASFSWGSSAIIQSSARETLTVDAETRELRMAFGRTFANGYALQLELPYRNTGAGSLDSFIDGWHDFFGLPEGARPALPRDSLRIAYEREERLLIDERSSHSGIGDVALRVGKQLGSMGMTAWLGVKLPTGDADDWTGSGSVDVTAALAAEHELSDRFSVFAQAAASWLSDGDRLASQQEQIVWSGVAGITARAFTRLTLTAQIDAHTAVFDSNEDFLGDAVMLTIGGGYRIGDRWNVSFAVTEDIAVETASDVVFLFQIKRR